MERESNKLDLRTLELLRGAGVSFSSSLDAPGGSESIWSIDISDLQAIVDDKEDWYARSKGGAKADYRNWLEADGLPICGATTKSGMRCKNPVSGGIQRHLLDWLNEDAGFCTVHGGKTSAEAKSERWESR